jgi:glutathione S-transferase
MTAQPIAVYFWPTPNGHKITIALEELGLPYEIHPVNIGAGDQFKPDFLAISPNNRMPAIVDPDGPDGEPLSIFESGAILQYLSRKTGKLYGDTERERAEIDSWLFWQMGGLGPMAGQAHHFLNYAPKIEENAERLVYGQERYRNEVNRLYGVMNTRLKDRDYLAGPYSMADVASYPWVLPDHQGQDMADFPHLEAWRKRVGAREAVQRGRDVGKELRRALTEDSEEMKKARDLLFGQKARSA